MTDDGLAAEAIDSRTERLIEVEAGQQSVVLGHVVDARAEHDALHDVGRPKPHSLQANMMLFDPWTLLQWYQEPAWRGNGNRSLLP